MSIVSSFIYPVAATANGIFAGLSLTLNFVSIPTLRATGYPIAVWAATVKYGGRIAVPSILISSAMHFYAYYLTGEPRSLYCGIASFISAPYTVIFMLRTNYILYEANANASHDKKQVIQLIEKWNKLQYFRTIAGVVALALALF